MWKGAIAVLFGVLAFGAGLWFFLPTASSPADSNAPAQPTAEVQAPASTPPVTSAPTSPPAITAEAPPISPKAQTKSPPKTPEKLSPAVDVNPRLTWDNYVQIHDGMTEDQVKSLLGDPTAADRRTDRDENHVREIKVLQWAQNKPFDMIEVEFIDGRASRTNSTLSPAPAPPEPGETPEKPPTAASAPGATLSKPPAVAGAPVSFTRLTRANFEQIVNGMTEDQVTAIFGRPNGTTSRTITMEGNTFHRKTLMWVQHEPYIKITVTLHEGKVAGKNCIQIGPKKP